MCEPVLIIGGLSLAASAAGGYMQYEAQQAALSAQRRASDRAAAAGIREQQRQEDIRARGQPIAEETAQEGARASVDERVDAAAAHRLAGLEAASEGNAQNRDIGGQAGSSNLVMNSIADRTAEARAKLGSEAMARARMGAWGDAFTGIGEANQRRRETIDMLGSFSRGSLGAEGVEQAAAAKQRELGAYEGLGDRTLGGGISALGNAGLANSKQIAGWFSSPSYSGTSPGTGVAAYSGV